MSSYLVTGSQGFIGKRLKTMLISQGHDVTGFDSDNFQDQKEFLSSLDVSQFEAIFHVGANSSTMATNLQAVFETNYLFTRDLSLLARVENVPLIYSSSAACYGANGDMPSNLYAWSKLAGEDVVIRDGGVALRYFNVYGPGECHKGSMASFVHQAVTLSKAGHQVRLFPKEPRRDFIHVDDVCEANMAALQLFSQISGRAYDVGTGSARSFEECLSIAGVPWKYTDEDAIPVGYQFFTEASQEKFIPGWRAQPFEQRMKSYCSVLQESCDH